MDREARERERNLRRVEEERRRTRAETRAPRLDVKHILDDFKLIQVAGNELALAASRGGELDLRLVAKSAADIRKSAGRLSASLGLPESEEGRKSPAADDARRRGFETVTHLTRCAR